MDTPRESGLRARLMVCAQMHETRHRGVRATVHRLATYYPWDGMENDAAELVWQCLHDKL